MSELTDAQGRCLCGAVKLTTTSASSKVGACHCNICRQWSGGPWMAVDCGTAVEIKGMDSVKTYHSSEWAERGFCLGCGTTLFYRLKTTGQYIVSAGILDIESQLDFDHQVFIDEKPSYYCFSNQTKDMTGAEIFAMYGAE